MIFFNEDKLLSGSHSGRGCAIGKLLFKVQYSEVEVGTCYTKVMLPNDPEAFVVIWLMTASTAARMLWCLL